jgi:integrase
MSVHPLHLPTAATPLADYLQHEWLPRHEPTWASGSRRHRRWTVGILSDSRLARRPIGELTVLEIERYFAERAGQPFPQKGQLPARGSLRAIFTTLKSCLGDAVRYGIITDNPCTRVRLPMEPAPELDAWTVDEVRTFLASQANSRYLVLWRLLLATGMRRGEALGLQWQDLELDLGRLRIVRAMIADSRRDNIVFGAPKNRKSRRTLSLDVGTCESLREWRLLRESECGPLSGAVQVFALADGSPMLPAGVSDTWRRAVRRAGVRPIPLHGTRHTHISHLLAAGEPLAHVSARVGHATSAMTLRTYAHVIAGDDAQTALRAGALFA